MRFRLLTSGAAGGGLLLAPLHALSIFLVLLGAGCATTPSDQEAYQRNGTLYGKTDGPFRGRWWNYYERGRSFSDGGFWTEAEANLRTAMAMRGGDQLWPRTYGLHFLPEYFPHRELGVVLYHQEALAESIKELEVSLDQQYSARAAFFLDRARSDLIRKDGSDAEAPNIEILSPSAMDTLSGETIVQAFITDDTYVKRVWVNGEAVDLLNSARETSITHTLMADSTVDRITVEAEDLAGRRAKEALPVQVDGQGPVVSFDLPVVLPGRVSGTVADSAGIRSLEIAGTGVPVGMQQGQALPFVADVPPEAISSHEALVFRCTDNLGNTTEGQIRADLIRIGSMSSVPGALCAQAVGLGSSAIGIAAVWHSPAPAVLRPAAMSPEPLVARFDGVADGQRYYLEEIVVTVDAYAGSPLASIVINGVPADLLPQRPVQVVSRRLRLNPGPNDIEAIIRDAAGNERAIRATVMREPSSLELVDHQLSGAVLGVIRSGNPMILEGEDEFVVSEIESKMQEQRRFALLDRQFIQQVLEEQTLSASVGTKQGRLMLGRSIPAEVLFVGRVHRDLDSFECVLEAISTDTAIPVGRADVAGKAESVDQLSQLIEMLAQRMVQEFPRLTADVTGIRSKKGIEIRPDRLRLSIDDAHWSHTAGVPEEAASFVREELRHALNRSGGVTVLNEAVYADIERELAIGTAYGISKLPPHVFLSGAIHSEDGKCVLNAEITESGTQRVLARPRVEGGGFDRASIRVLSSVAADEIKKALSDYEVPAEQVNAPRVLEVGLGRESQIRESSKLLLYRQGEPIVDPFTGAVLGYEIAILSEALVRAVKDRGSIAEMQVDDALASAVRVGDEVITK